MAGHTGSKTGAHAEVQRIAAEFGLGRHVKVWRRGWSKTTERVLLFGFVIGLPLVTVMLVVTANPKSSTLPMPDIVALGVVMSLPVLFAFRSRPTLHEFEGGLASVTTHRRRVTVVRWADLAALREHRGTDQDGDEHFYGWLLQDHAGNTVDIGKRTRELRARAEQILAARVSGPAH